MADLWRILPGSNTVSKNTATEKSDEMRQDSCFYPECFRNLFDTIERQKPAFCTETPQSGKIFGAAKNPQKSDDDTVSGFAPQSGDPQSHPGKEEI